MQRTPVSSSTVAGIGYDIASHTLEIEFNDGRVYQYFDVPQAIYEAFIQASSKGVFLAQQIKGAFRYERV